MLTGNLVTNSDVSLKRPTLDARFGRMDKHWIREGVARRVSFSVLSSTSLRR